jgi:hypothetical protein
METVFINTTNYGRHWLEKLAADSWNRMVRDGCPPHGITDAGRTLQEQITVFLKYFTTDFASSAKFDPRGWNGRTYWRAYQPGGRLPWPSAATPGSVFARHTFGRALDLNGATKSWVRANGHRYGWLKDLVRGEDWHMEYQPMRDVVLIGSVITVRPPVPTVPDLPDVGTLTPEPIPDPEAVTNVVAIIRLIDTGDISYVSDNGTVTAAATIEEVFAMAKALRLPPEQTWVDLDGFEHTRVLQACDRIRRGQG